MGINLNREPNFFIVGAPKCGTTSMHSYLSQHPDIFMSQNKEPHYFGGGRRSHPLTTWENYLDNFKRARSERRVGESSTGYLYSAEACERIYEYNHDAKIIIMLRNPVDMIYAWHSELLWLCIETEKDFSRALELERERINDRHLPSVKGIELIRWRLQYRQCGSYYKFVKQYLETFGSEKVHIIVFEDFIADPEAEYRRCLRFLNVDESFTPSFTISNSNRYPIFWPLRRWVLTSDSFCKKMLLRYVPRVVRKKMTRLTHYSKPRPPLGQNLRLELGKYFQTDISHLENLIHLDLSIWDNKVQGTKHKEQIPEAK